MATSIRPAVFPNHDLKFVIGEDLLAILAELKAEGRTVESLSVGGSPAEWVLVIRPRSLQQPELKF